MGNEVANAQPMPETAKKNAASSIVGLRPKRSLSLPANATPTIEPMSAQPTNHPTCSSSSENWAAMCETVPDTTPVS